MPSRRWAAAAAAVAAATAALSADPSTAALVEAEAVAAAEVPLPRLTTRRSTKSKAATRVYTGDLMFIINQFRARYQSPTM